MRGSILHPQRWRVGLRMVHVCSTPAQAHAARHAAAAPDAAGAARAAHEQQHQPQAAARIERERIAADGSLRVAREAYERQAQPRQQQQQQHPRPPGLAAAAPIAPPLPQERLEELVDMIASSRWGRGPGSTACGAVSTCAPGAGGGRAPLVPQQRAQRGSAPRPCAPPPGAAVP
jgi:hypothetical protein